MTNLGSHAASVQFIERRTGDFTIGLIVLHNPRALNALTVEMFRAMERQLLEWRERVEVACLVLHASSDRAFCSGGDVKALVTALTSQSGLQAAADFFTSEYFVDYLIHRCPKPILCWADGITMGGGVGIMNGASSRVVTERTVLAMPEIGIGLFPDVGGTYFLNRMPEGVGLFLGLTSARLSGADAVAIGMADSLISAARKEEIFDGLAQIDWSFDRSRNHELLQRHLQNFARPVARNDSAIFNRLKTIQSLTLKTSIADVDGAMRAWQGDDEWMRNCLANYFGGSPTSASAFYQQLTAGKHLSLEQIFLREWDMALNFCSRSDFLEGVRARLIDKDQNPRWNPPKLAEVSDGDIERLFSSAHGQAPYLLRKLNAYAATVAE